MRRLYKAQVSCAAAQLVPEQPPAFHLNQAQAAGFNASPTVAAAAKKKKKTKLQRRIQIKACGAEDPRVVRVEVLIFTESSGVKSSTVCTVVGMSDNGAALAYKRIEDGVTCLYIAPAKIMPRGTRKLMEKADSRRGARQEPTDIQKERLGTSDFQACTLHGIAGFVCVKAGPFFRITCDSAMKDTLISSVTYWKRRTGINYKFRVVSEPLRLASPPSYLPLENAKCLDVDKTFLQNATHLNIFNAVLRSDARRPFGDRSISYTSVPDVVRGIMGAEAYGTGSLCDTLKLTRDVLGSTFQSTTLGTFVLCANQTTLPWGTARRCCCHVASYSGSAKLSTIKFCLEKSPAKKRPLDNGTGGPAVGVETATCLVKCKAQRLPF